MEESMYDETGELVGISNAAQQNALIANQNKQLQYQMEESEKNLAEAQLDVEETLLKLAHLLRQDVKRIDPETKVYDWFPIDDEKKRVLTDEGIDRIMQLAEFYINKETLLSNFDDKMINRRMLAFSLSFSGLIFMKYEVMFRTPTLEECNKILKDRIEERVKKRIMAKELQGVEFSEEAIRKEITSELDERFEYEITKIKEERKKINLKEIEMMFTQIQALIESTHNRAWKGEERGSLRRHFNISEVIGGRNPAPNRNSGSWFGFGK